MCKDEIVMYYSLNIVIPNYLCDRFDTLSMWGMARILQEVADRHAATNGIGFAELSQANKAWVLSRVYYKVERLPKEGEEVKVTTWSRGTDGLFAFREYTMETLAGERLVSGTSYWVVINYIERKAIRMHDLMDGYEFHPDLATDRETLGRVRVPKTELPPVSCFEVKPSMLDHNNHVNNAEYIKWIFDNLADDTLRDPHRDFRFTLEYFQETPPVDTVSVFRIPTEDATYFQISNSRTVAVTAKVENV